VLQRAHPTDRLVDPDAFTWLAGIEDTFITAASPRTGRTLDEYELTGHYAQVEPDLALFAELGVRAVRYGIPWHRINPSPGAWDFSWADRALGRLLDLGITPIVDLVHYGLPGWIEGAYLNPSYPHYVADYAGRVAERYRGRIRTYTPLNEPRITAWYCGRLGWWPPFRRSWRGFVQVMLAVCRGIVRTVERLREVDPAILCVHVDATDLYDTTLPELQAEAELRQHIVFLALDLITGRVAPDHPLFDWLRAQGADEKQLAACVESSVALDLLGINLYPMFSHKWLTGHGSRLRTRMRYAGGEIVERLAELYWQRYRTPLFISETAALGSVARRRRWLDDSVQAVARVRARGVPLVGYTWWPLFALVGWAYREGRLPADRYLLQMGLWNLERHGDGLRRVRTELVDRYQALVAGGTAAVGPLAAGDGPPPLRAAAGSDVP
jgi:beta-glucosidase/6-phospho-beta-glucosidase/beta-galactosidase